MSRLCTLLYYLNFFIFAPEVMLSGADLSTLPQLAVAVGHQSAIVLAQEWWGDISGPLLSEESGGAPPTVPVSLWSCVLDCAGLNILEAYLHRVR